MQAIPPSAGVSRVDLDGAVALFADASAAGSTTSPEVLARSAGTSLAPLLGRPVPVLYCRQEHTRLTFSYSEASPLEAGPHLVGRCDGLITAEPEVGLVVRTADCLPVAIAGGGAVAMVHAGWRGLAADILAATVGRLKVEYGVAARELSAAIGVGIGRCHFEVGQEVIEALAVHPVSAKAWHGDRRVDLAAWAQGRLQVLGLGAAKITVLEGCTACSRQFHSHRRDGASAGRQWSAVVIPGEGGASRYTSGGGDRRPRS